MSISDVTYLLGYLLGKITPYEYVDLDLPSGTLWATCNVGAESPEEYGDYFAWGETETKSNYDWSTYTHCNGSQTTLTKYCTDSSCGTVDNLTELTLEDDAAYVCWGSKWCMPSEEQFEELINSEYTTTTWTTQNGVNGYLITSKSNGNSIFLPAAGYYNDSELGSGGSRGYYWSRTLSSSSTSSTSRAYSMVFRSDDITAFNVERCRGRSIRPVRYQTPGPTSVTDITLSATSLRLPVGSTQTVTATVRPARATDRSVTWVSSNPAVATVSADGLVTAVAFGSCTITCTAADGSGVSVTCTVRVFTDNSGFIGGYWYIDLGLPSGTLWANKNIGATDPEDYGLYFAWGETTGYTSDTSDGHSFDWSTYKWCNGSNNSDMTKYCTDTNPSYGTVDNKTELDLEDDAAYVNWGPNWRMPSREQLAELINSEYTTTEWTKQTDVYGLKITSISNGNSIFLPAAGYRIDTLSDYVGAGGYSSGNYWSRTLTTSSPYAAGFLDFNWRNSPYTAGFGSRFYGYSVRPVRNQ